MCFDVSDGTFKFREGGHLVLHEPQLIIRLPPGRIVLFPSAAITHQNISIGEGETRYSLTGYSSGSLWRFRAQGWQTQAEWKSKNPEAEADHAARGEERWLRGCERFKTIEELRALWKAAAEQAAP